MKSTAELENIVTAYFNPLIGDPRSAQVGRALGILVGTTFKGTHHSYMFGEVPLGMSDAAHPAIEDIVTFIGSNTKVFTATLLALASYQKTPIAINGMSLLTDLLPTNARYTEWTGVPTRLWHLATHSAGYPDGPCGQQTWGDYPFFLMQRFLALFAPQYEPGRYWVYSDQGFALLGVLLSHAFSVTGSPPQEWDGSYQNWPSIVAEQVLSPLGLTATAVGCTMARLPLLAQSFDCIAGRPYKPLEVPSVNLEAASLGAGALTSTLADMLTFLDHQISPPSGPLGAAISLTQEPQGSQDNPLAMGLGWQIGNAYFDKNGLVAGYASYMAFDPTAGWGLFAVANSRGGDDGGLFCTTARACFGALRGQLTTPPAFPLPPPGRKPACPPER